MVNVCLIFFMLGFLTHFALVHPRMILNGVIWYGPSIIRTLLFFVNLYVARKVLVSIHESNGRALRDIHGLAKWMHELNGQALHALDELVAFYLDLLLRFVSLLLSLIE